MGKPIIWSGTNAKLINSGDLIDKNNLSLTNGAKITVTQASHGFTSSDVGCPLYLNGSTWTKAIASTSATAEVAGFIYSVIDSNTLRIASSGQCPAVGANFLEGGGSLTAGELYFLSATSAGKVTATEPNTVGYISKPVAIATSTGAVQFLNMRGYVVGAANARTQISLSNNTTGNVQDVTPYDAGNITGWVYIDATTDYRFYVSISWAKNGAGTNWNINYSTVGDTPPAGFSFTITSGGIIQYTMPSVTGFVSSQFNYAINAPAVGTLFPLSIDGSAVVSGTVAAARLPVASASASGIVDTSTQVIAGNKTFNGLTTLGTATNTPYSAGYTTTNNNLCGSTPGATTDLNGGFVISGNAYNSTISIPTRRSGLSGASIFVAPRTTDTANVLTISSNLTGDSATTNYATIAAATAEGKWTFGKTAGTSSHAINGSFTVTATPDNYSTIKSTTALTSGEAVALTFNDTTTGKAEIGGYYSSGAGSSGGYIWLRNGTATGYYLWQNTGTWYTGSTSGNIGTTTGTVIGTQTSDERLKTNIADIQYGLSTIQQLQPVSFDLNGKPCIGFIAQRTENVLPEAVYDTGDVIVEGERTKLAMDYSTIIPVLVKGMQELKAELDAAKVEIETLKTSLQNTTA